MPSTASNAERSTVPRLRLQQIVGSPSSADSSDEATTPTFGPRDALWEVDVQDLGTSIWLSPRDKQEALEHLKNVGVRLSDDGWLGLSVRAPNTTRKRRSSRSRANSGGGGHTSSGSNSSSSSSSSKHRNLVANISIKGFNHHKNPHLAEDVAVGRLAPGDVIKFINGQFVDCFATFNSLINEAQVAHEAKLAKARCAGSTAAVVSTLVLGLCPAAVHEAKRAAARGARARTNSSTSLGDGGGRSRANSDAPQSDAQSPCAQPQPVRGLCVALPQPAVCAQRSNQSSPDTPRPEHSDSSPGTRERCAGRRRGRADPVDSQPQQQQRRHHKPRRQRPQAAAMGLTGRQSSFRCPTKSRRNLLNLAADPATHDHDDILDTLQTALTSADKTAGKMTGTVPDGPFSISLPSPLQARRASAETPLSSSLPLPSPSLIATTTGSRMPVTHRKRRSSLSAAAANILANAANQPMSAPMPAPMPVPLRASTESPVLHKVLAVERDAGNHRRSRSDSRGSSQDIPACHHRRVCSDSARISGASVRAFDFAIRTVLGARPACSPSSKNPVDHRESLTLRSSQLSLPSSRGDVLTAGHRRMSSVASHGSSGSSGSSCGAEALEEFSDENQFDGLFSVST